MRYRWNQYGAIYLRHCTTYLVVVKPIVDFAEMERMSLLVEGLMKFRNAHGIILMYIANFIF